MPPDPAERPPRLFICYRVEDSGEAASRLASDLMLRFGPGAVFVDHAGLEGGDDWPQRLRDEVAKARVVFVLAGARWLDAADAAGKRRLAQPDDWVRLEVETALDSGATVVPVRVGDAPPLTRAALADLPTLARLADLQARRLRREDWDADVQKLAALLERRGFVPLVGPTTGPTTGPVAGDAGRRRRLAIGAAALAAALVAGGAAWWLARRPAPQPPPVAVPAPMPSGSPPGSAPVVPATAPAPAPPPPPLERRALDGRVAVRALFAADFAAQRARFTIEARDAGANGLGESPLGADGRFRVDVALPAAAADPGLVWAWSAPGDFVLWPLAHPDGPPPFDGFRFDRLKDLYFREKTALLGLVREGKAEAAGRRLDGLAALLAMYGEGDRPTLPGFTRNALELALLHETCSAASRQRSAVGRSRVADEAIGIEREWRRRLFDAAARSARPVAATADALNAWAAFAREVYSLRQQAWTDRSPLADPAGLLASPAAADLLREDLVEVGARLRALRADAAGAAVLAALSPAQRTALAQAADGDADKVSMSRLADALRALNAAAAAAR